MNWDTVVVGAGPAGSAVAARLAVLGHRTLLLERGSFPRRKPCGECLSPAAVDQLQRLGALAGVEALDPAPLDGWRVVAPGGASFTGRFPAGKRGMGVRRSRLDEVLARHAASCGAVLREGVRVTDLLRENGRVLGVRTSTHSGTGAERAPLVIGADGLRSVVLRRLGLVKRPPRLRKVALVAPLKGPATSTLGELRLFSGGCVGLAPVDGGGWNGVVVAGEELGAEVRGDGDGFFDRTVRRVAGDGFRRVEPVLATGPFDWPVKGAVADGALLVGDAAGYYDPFTGQGVYRALRGAELAANAAERALGSGDLCARSLASYDRAVRRAFLPGVRVQRLIELVLARPRLFGAIAGRLRARPGLADRLVAVTGDLAPVRTLWGISP
ncbi:MAG: NAD(P)/FAD-dependent oxidoreductase [Longimicrobiaceae bacterium]